MIFCWNHFRDLKNELPALSLVTSLIHFWFGTVQLIYSLIRKGNFYSSVHLIQKK